MGGAASSETYVWVYAFGERVDVRSELYLMGISREEEREKRLLLEQSTQAEGG